MKIPDEIDATGERDETAALSAFFAGLRNGSRIDFAEDGIYRADGNLDIAQKFGFNICGNNATLIAGTPGGHSRRQLCFVQGGDHVLRDLHIVGANAKGGRSNDAWVVGKEDQPCLSTRGVKGLCVTGCEFSYSYGDGIYLNRWNTGVKSDWAEDVWISGCHVHHTGRHGITFMGVRNAVVTACTVEEVRRATFEFEPTLSAHDYAEGIHIVGNIVGLGRLLLIAAHGSGPVNNVWFIDNTVARPLDIWVKDGLGARRSGWHVLRNTVSMPGGNPKGNLLRFTRVDGVEVRDNVQPLKASQHMALVALEDCSDTDVGGNSVPGGVELAG